jgi:hypothetical protein
VLQSALSFGSNRQLLESVGLAAAQKQKRFESELHSRYQTGNF